MTGQTPLARTSPEVHFTPAAGWMNDPLGLTFHDGLYHLFYQYVPGQLTWDVGCQWGHATSTDLLHWSEQPVALAPGQGDDGCWSGSIAVPADGETVMFYTAVHKANQAMGEVRVARPRDKSWEEWDKGDVVATCPTDLGVFAFRDPFVFRDGARWRMLVGAGRSDGTACALVYRSDDLASWSFEGPLAERPTTSVDPLWTGTLWECPQLIPIGDKHVLVVSVWENDNLHYVAAAVGTYRDGRFTAESWRRLTFGAGHYAASAFVDKDGQPGLIMWIRGVASPDWTGTQSVPYTLSLSDGQLSLVPHRNLEQARTTATPGSSAQLLDIEWEPDQQSSAQFSLVAEGGDKVARLSAKGAEVTVEAGSGAATSLPRGEGPIRVLVDGPVLEVVTSGGCLAVPISDAEPLRPESDPSGMLRRWDIAAATE